MPLTPAPIPIRQGNDAPKQQSNPRIYVLHVSGRRRGPGVLPKTWSRVPIPPRTTDVICVQCFGCPSCREQRHVKIITVS